MRYSSTIAMTRLTAIRRSFTTSPGRCKAMMRVLRNHKLNNRSRTFCAGVRSAISDHGGVEGGARLHSGGCLNAGPRWCSREGSLPSAAGGCRGLFGTGPWFPRWQEWFAVLGALASGTAVRAGWLLAWLRPLIVRGRPSTVNGAAHLFPPAKSAPPEKDGPAGRH